MLTNSGINKLKAKDKTYLLSDGANLYIQVKPNGKKSFLHIYTAEGKRVKKVIGEFGEIDLNGARLAVLQSKKETCNKIKVKEVVSEWLNVKSSKVEFKGFLQIKSVLSRTIVKEFGHKAFCELTKGDVVQCVNLLKDRLETQRRLLNDIKQIYNFAAMKDYIENNIVYSLNFADIFGKKSVTNYATVTDTAKINEMFLKIANSNANFSVKAALAFNALTALRPGSVIALKWENVDMKNKILIFSSDEMKMKRGFILPLSNEAFRVIEFTAKYAKHDKFVFASVFGKSGHISDNTTRKLLRDLGIGKGEFTPHGFRAMFSTLANENGKDIDTIERCLAHVIGGVRGVYDRSEKLTQKREIMQWWGEFISPYLNLDKILDFSSL